MGGEFPDYLAHWHKTGLFKCYTSNEIGIEHEEHRNFK